MLTPSIAFTWETRTGEILLIKEMDTNHIRNAIKHIENLASDFFEHADIDHYTSALNGLYLELRLRNEKF